MNTYLVRGIAVALSEFVLAYFALWLSVACGWTLWAKDPRRLARANGPNFLYLLQLAPFFLSVFVVLVFAVPAFVRFEPQRGEEEFGLPIIFLGCVCLLFLALGVWRAATAILRTRTLVRQWNGSAHSVQTFAGLPLMETAADAPPLVVTGLFRPRLYVSASASEVLTEQELARAIAHESAHVRRRDNVRKLLLRLCCVPSVRPLERQWLASLELAADAEAVRSRTEALDLASALVKASKLVSASPDLAMTFTSEGSELLRTRVERLLSWSDRQSQRPSHALIYTVASLAAASLLLWPWYSALLLAIHQFSEIIVR